MPPVVCHCPSSNSCQYTDLHFHSCVRVVTDAMPEPPHLHPHLLPLLSSLLLLPLAPTLLPLSPLQQVHASPGLRLDIRRFLNFHLSGSRNIDLTDFSLLFNSDVCDEARVDIVTNVSTTILACLSFRPLQRCCVILLSIKLRKP